MAVAGVLTVRGGMTSHAAVIARGLGKPAIVGARDLSIDAAKGRMVVGDLTLSENQSITLDGRSGRFYSVRCQHARQPSPPPISS